MAKKYTGPKREDGRLVADLGINEIRGYVAEDGILELWSFLKGDERGEQVTSLGPQTWQGLKRWARETSD